MTWLARLDEGFKWHAAAYLVIVPLLAAIDWYTAEPYWIHWVVLGWGAGLGLHLWLTQGR